MSVSPERRAAIEARFRARLSWLALGAVVVLLPMVQGSSLARGLVLALCTGVFVALNRPAVLDLQRAQAAGAQGWEVLAAALVLRSLAYVLVVWLAW
jgi:hypothetical protein